MKVTIQIELELKKVVGSPIARKEEIIDELVREIDDRLPRAIYAGSEGTEYEVYDSMVAVR